MKLLVTGGAGYIGSIVAAQLLDAGHDVTVLDSLYRGHAQAVPAGARHLDVDLNDAPATTAALAEGFDAVLHFAALALVAESVAHPERYHRGNFVATLNLLDAMRAAEVKRLVFSSTCAVYGEPAEVPRPETLPTDPVNAYGASKLAVDRMITAECRAHGLGVEQVDPLQAGALGHRRRVAALEVVEHRHVVAGVEQLGGHDRADIAGAAGHEELHAPESDTSLSVPFPVCPSV